MIHFVDYLLLLVKLSSGLTKYPDAGVLLSYEDDDYSQGYTQIEEAFRVSTKDDILKSYIYQITILVIQMLGMMMFVIVFTFSI